ncbi:bacteriocin [Nostoc sp. LEGE 12447]|nr:bacteriocin [Nostoc sp. LEGE 12447]MBE8997937.1 bacteriocin [Nostoc sp. LEGE 12447]
MKKQEKKEGKTQCLAHLLVEKLNEKEMSLVSGGGKIGTL